MSNKRGDGMNRKIKLSLLLSVTVISGYFGFNYAIISVLENVPFIGLCALVPLMVTVGFWLDEYEQTRGKELFPH